jgi:transcriptional regulator PpsR
MIREHAAAPDVKLVLNLEGIIQDVTLSNAFADEGVADWIGHPWAETVRHTDGESLRRMLEGAFASGVSAFHQVLQRFPSGLEIPIEYTAFRLEGKGTLLAVGKNLRAIAELQTRLVEAQQAMERDYWKLREVETRYRLLFNSSSDAVLLVRASDMTILELNPAAAEALAIPVSRIKAGGAGHFPDALLPEDRDVFNRMLRQVQQRGKAPGILLRLGDGRVPWLVRASLMASGLMASAVEESFLVQLSPTQPAPFDTDHDTSQLPIEDLLERAPDGFVVLDHEGAILRANRAFLDLVQMTSESSIIGEPLGRWLGRPGADLTVLLANVLRLGAVRLFSTTLHGELGSEIEVEISASGRPEPHPQFIGVFIRDVGRRLSAQSTITGVGQLMDHLTKQIGKTTLRKLVDNTIEVVERHYIEAALDLTAGNRTAAAELLGLSRQSLYVKLNRYGLAGNPKSETDATS